MQHQQVPENKAPNVNLPTIAALGKELQAFLEQTKTLSFAGMSRKISASDIQAIIQIIAYNKFLKEPEQKEEIAISRLSLSPFVGINHFFQKLEEVRIWLTQKDATLNQQEKMGYCLCVVAGDFYFR